jgi:hypothetical protein
MGGGYSAPPGDGLDPLVNHLSQVRRRLNEVERPTGTSLASLVAQVQAALANIDAKVQTSIAANSYTKAQIDSKIASPGDISPGNVNASGAVSAAALATFNAGITSTDVHNHLVTTGIVAVWVDSTGRIGYQPSTRGSKKDLAPLTDVSAVLSLQPYLGRYESDDQETPLRVFLIAEDVHEAGFGPDVAPLGDEGQPIAVNYSQLVVPLLAVVKQQQARLEAVEEQLAAITR